jgi:primosomal protein N' (replication factor Y)
VTTRAVDVAVDIPRLELDRPFTYRLPDGVEAGVGDLASVPFHGRTVKGWVLGAAVEAPRRMLPIRRVLSGRPVFDGATLELCRWMAGRYVAPLATVLGRAHPPRVASEEARASPPPLPPPPRSQPRLLPAYQGGPALVDACAGGSGAFVLRPLPEEEAALCLEAVGAALAGGRDAVVVVPEAEPLPATARAVADAFGDSCLLFAGGEPRDRYRAWLDLLAGRYRVVVGTRPAVFAPVNRLGLVWVNRDAHPGHREDRAPYHHVRDVALARARLRQAVCVLAALGPSAEAVALADDGGAGVVRAPRPRERGAAPLVEVTRPQAEDRSPRLGALLKASGGAFLLVSRRGAGVARVCRACAEPARCAACGGHIARRRGEDRCAVCGAEARCASCGAASFGVERGGTERVAQWAAGVAGRPVAVVDERGTAEPPGEGRVVVGTAAAVKDFGPIRTGLVAILDPDRAGRRAGLTAGEQALATWLEAAAWAGPRSGGGRVLLQTRDAGTPAIQAVVRWDPWHFHRAERRRRTEAGFPPGFPVFRVRGTDGLPQALRGLRPVTLLSSGLGDETVCLMTVRPEAVESFRDLAVGLAEAGVLTRVEAEPHL